MYGLWALPFVVCLHFFVWQCSLKGQRCHCGKIQFLWCLLVCRIFGQLKVMDFLFPCDFVLSFTIWALLCRANMPIKLVCRCSVESVDFWKYFYFISFSSMWRFRYVDLHTPQFKCGGQRRACRNQISLSTMWIPGIKLCSSGLVKYLYPQAQKLVLCWLFHFNLCICNYLTPFIENNLFPIGF